MALEEHDKKRVTSQFLIHGDMVRMAPYGDGHINDTYASVFDQAGTTVRYIHQRVNRQVFRNTAGLMENIQRVTAYQRHKLQETGCTDASRRALTLVPTRDGKSYWTDDNGDVWRTYLFIEKAATYNSLTGSGQAYQAARAFGEFQRAVSDLSGPRLHETIPQFHDTEKRFRDLMEAVEADAMNRAKDVAPEIAFANERAGIVCLVNDRLADGRLPERVTHNDTKINNVMLDDASGEGVCVIDLDTVMPGSALFDFGDMVRTSTCPCREDTADLNEVVVHDAMFEALVKGYLAGAGDFLTDEEIALLAFSGRLITFEIGLRFLTDYLEGDTYFRTHRPAQNVDRCRVQFALVRSIEEKQEELQMIVQRVLNDGA
ncbi:MAG: aminoglycoside phosphotransferase family protein [Candidatus Pacebacteria bacterium]|nr:aminoglycoside phosphotransferase family protein [Candidatus Paceibacterota bacterium]